MKCFLISQGEFVAYTLIRFKKMAKQKSGFPKKLSLINLVTNKHEIRKSLGGTCRRKVWARPFYVKTRAEGATQPVCLVNFSFLIAIIS